MPSHELDQDAWLDEFGANTDDAQPTYTRRSPLSPKAPWPAADPLFDLNTPLSELGLADGPTEKRLLAERAGAPAPPTKPEPPHVQLLRLAHKAFPGLTLRVGMYCDVNGISGTSTWRFVLKASGQEVGAAKLTASGDTPDACIEAMIPKVNAASRAVIDAREARLRSRAAA